MLNLRKYFESVRDNSLCTNYEKIKKMSVEDMAKFLAYSECRLCIYNTFDNYCFKHFPQGSKPCPEGIKAWLLLVEE